MRSFLAESRARLPVWAAAVLLAGCTLDIPTNPDTFNVEPGRMSHLRQPQSIALDNGHAGPAVMQIKQSPHTLVIDLRQLTDTAITMLGRAMSKQGISVDPQSPKKVTLRIQRALVASAPAAPAQVLLEAQFGDGTKTILTASNTGFSAQRALDGAVLFALNGLLVDVKFVAYMNR
jgi:hypothetical protein